MMLDGGVWKGRRLLNAGYVRRLSSPLRDLKNIKYGFLWWSIDWPYKGRTVRAFFAGGNGGQAIIVVPELDMVVGLFGSSYSSRQGLEIQQGYTPRYILPATLDRGESQYTPIKPATYRVVYGLQKQPARE
jgi:CubicO group peptidase (beta-lactamase class C family)